LSLLLITNDIPPYYKDIANCLALPEGMVYRFRYSRIPLDLTGSLVPKSVVGKSGIIVFRQRSTSRLVPIRRAKILNVLETKFLVVIEFAVAGFLCGDLHSLGEQMHKAIATHRVRDQMGGDLVPLVYDIDVDIDAGASAVESLEEEAETVTGGYRQSTLLRILIICQGFISFTRLA
jgi:hypothetical protein